MDLKDDKGDIGRKVRAGDKDAAKAYRDRAKELSAEYRRLIEAKKAADSLAAKLKSAGGK